MKQADASSTALEALSHPLILKGAWLRVDGWFRSGNLAPEPELSRWRLHAEAALRELGAELADNTWRPDCWQQVPYPKKGACLRHYVQPTVRDQIAFMAYLVLLGPLLDRHVPPFVFGNRWNRAISWDRRQAKPHWVHRPYQLLTSSSYLRYSRSHGLFRRVAHWTAARITGAEIDHQDFAGHVQHPEDYEDSSLPPWIRERWWSRRDSGDARAFWATLDIELAYPSIYLDRLRRAMRFMLLEPLSESDLSMLYGGYPAPVMRVLANPHSVQVIADRLIDALEKVRVNRDPIPDDTWQPVHPVAHLPPDKQDIGLPTGLAVSGILLNVALFPADRFVSDYLDGQRSGAVVRFADDIFVLAQSSDGLFDLMETVWQGIAEDSTTRLAIPESKSNLHLNWNKIEPPAVHEIVRRFLNEQGWTECEGCGQPLRPSEDSDPQSLGGWWREGIVRHERGSHTSEFARLIDALRRSSIGPGEVGPFVTTLVARMSEIGRDSLAERFGQGARERLIRLHELARFDIDDMQVRSDTRRAFAVNRLVRAWIPPDNAGEENGSRKDLADIRASVAYVLKVTPWKFSLWQAVVRSAARRPEPMTTEDDRTAREWLSRQLSLVADPPDRSDADAWMNTWPEEGESTDQCARGAAWRSLYLSFHRAAFWDALAGVLRSLWLHVDQAVHPAPGYCGPAPEHWTVRAIPDGSHMQVARHLASIDQWVDVLYGRRNAGQALAERRWELDQLVAAVLASASRYELADTWRHAQPPADELLVPTGSVWSHIPRTIQLLEQAGRVSPTAPGDRALDTSTLAHVRLAGHDSRLGALLFPPDEAARIADAQDDPSRAVAAGVSLGCSANIGSDLASVLVPDPDIAIKALEQEAVSLWDYHRARRVLLGQAKGSQ